MTNLPSIFFHRVLVQLYALAARAGFSCVVQCGFIAWYGSYCMMDICVRVL